MVAPSNINKQYGKTVEENIYLVCTGTPCTPGVPAIRVQRFTTCYWRENNKRFN